MTRGSQVRIRGGSDIQAPGGLRELQVVKALILIVGMGDGAQPNPRYLANIRGIGRGYQENLSVLHAGGAGGDGWSSAFE